MDFKAIQEFITSVGFPIACVLYMFYRDEKQQARHAEETAKFVEAINNNTCAVNALKEVVTNGK